MNSDFVPRNPNELSQELLIIRRRSGGKHEHPHGGIWKIAYADFMTAMMAFFLVMWLLNATDKQTISAVASYFNPVKLTDHVRKPKGLNDIEADAHQAQDPAVEATRIKGNPTGEVAPEGSFRPTFREETLFSDPYKVLAQLAERAKRDEPDVKRNKKEAADVAFRDPFDPDFRFLVARANAGELKPAPQPLEESGTDQSFAEPLEHSLEPPSDPSIAPKSRLGSGEAIERTSAEPPKEPGAAPSAGPKEPNPPPPVEKDIAEAIRSSVNNAIPGRKPNIEVVSTSDGVLISLTDEFDFGMFAIASAEPSPELVVIMEQLAKVLKDYPGPLIVRGHTDGRPFRTKTYDNWRLSSARAHMAYFMLVRGGLDESRFERIEGYADRNLKVPSDPEAAQNRRIEILLRTAGTS
ncbi:MAG TPA: MotB family protein [Hyphomicrobiaceae bacterium]